MASVLVAESQFGPSSAALLLMPTPETAGPGVPIFTALAAAAPAAVGTSDAAASANANITTTMMDRRLEAVLFNAKSP
jgi:hypothetical protein